MLNFFRTTTVLFLLSLVIVSSGCKKDDDDDDSTPTSPSQEELLAGSTSKSWKVTKTTFNGVDNTPDVLCELDNITIFSRDKTYEMNEGDTKCDSADPQIISHGTWDFNTDKTILNLKPDGIDVSSSHSIVELTPSTLQISFIVGLDTIEYTYTAL